MILKCRLANVFKVYAADILVLLKSLNSLNENLIWVNYLVPKFIVWCFVALYVSNFIPYDFLRLNVHCIG